MNKNLFQFDQSEWWILLIIIASLGLTWFLYSLRKTTWTKSQNWILASIRFFAIFFIILLFLDPYINQTVTRIEKPIVAIAIDNSQSISARSDTIVLKNQISKLRVDLINEEIDARIFYLNTTDSLLFDQPTTDISELQHKISSAMEGRNWVATVLFSDGVFNKGSSPIYKQNLVSQFTIGLGDTIPPRDINISRVLYNRVSFKGNETPIKVEVTQKGYDGQEVKLNLSEYGKIIDQKTINLTQSIQEVEFTIKSNEEGLRRMQLNVPFRSTEFIKENNRASIFMEVIDGKQKVLIVGGAPHPDIKAIRAVLSSTDNYQVDVYIPSMSKEKPKDIYDVVIYHGAFTRGVDFTQKEDPGSWYILNTKSSPNLMRNEIPFFNIRRRGSQLDNVTASINPSFSKFNVPDKQDLFEDFPPISVPFGEYSLSGPTEVLLYQKVGSFSTKKPLFAFYDDGSRKSAVLAGENIWKWKLQESAIEGNANTFRDIVTKTVQYLSVKNDKQQFRFRSRGNNFSDLRAIIFDAEVYNDIYERIYGNNISLRITSDDGSSEDFEFVDSEYNSTFKVPPLKSGIYSYQASTKIGTRTFTDRGQFLVEEINREYLNLTADHNLLRNLSLRTGGEYFHNSEMDQVFEKLKEEDFKSIIRSNESFFPLIQNYWMLLIILILFSSEWLLRKYWGSY